MEDIRFSIIIPVYNTPDSLLKRCIESVYRQKYPAYEVILIDDGSEQDCARTMDEIGAEHANVTVYHIANGGVSNARNIGVEKVQGNWLFFVDADDVVADRMLSDAREAILEYPEVEIVYGYIRYEKNFSGRQLEVEAASKMYKLTQAGLRKLLRHMIALEDPDYRKKEYYVYRGQCGRAIKTSLARQFSFPLDIELGEDLIWNIEILKTSPQAVVVNSIWYYYVLNHKSATQKFSAKSFFQWHIHLKKLDDLLGEDEDLHSTILAQAIEVILWALKSHYLHPEYRGSLFKANEEFKQIRKNGIFAKYAKWKYSARLSWKRKIKWLILYKNPFPVYLINWYYIIKNKVG